MKTFHYYKTNHGIFFKQVPVGYYAGSGLSSIHEINGIPAADIVEVHAGWYRLDKEIESVTVLKSATTVHTGWELKDKTLPLPHQLTLDDLTILYNADDGEYKYGGPAASTGPLYERTYQSKPPEVCPVEFTATLIRSVEIDSYTRPTEMKIKMISDSSRKIEENLLANIVSYDDLEQILVPEFLLHTRPCSLTSQQVYSIVRHHIRTNINNNHARIISDYDFCFSVKKVVKTPSYMSTESFLKGRHWKTRSVKKTEKLIDLFSMTYYGYKGTGGYEGHPCISGWTANSLEEMAQQVREYLDRLMDVINKPAEECSCCKGTGVVTTPIGVDDHR